jgi:hypothetical protein
MGCATVREEQKPISDVVLMVSRGANETILTWNSRRGERYMILYAESRDSVARWRPLPGAEAIVGTGAPITIRDAVPADRPRFYRIDVSPFIDRRP